jgi:hypothetical protein
MLVATGKVNTGRSELSGASSAMGQEGDGKKRHYGSGCADFRRLEETDCMHRRH